MIHRNARIAFTAAILLSFGAVHAQQDPQSSTSLPSATQPATPGAPAKPADPKLSTTESVTVTAQGEVRGEQSLSSEILAESSPGTSPIESLAKLPSVNVTTADPYGTYEWALRISVRGFNQNQLGFTLDDVPLGDMSYGNLNGLHISRAVISENLGRVTLSQGTGALETASTSNLGGAVQFSTADPLDTRHLDIRQTFGSFAGVRTFGRFDSGLLKTHTKFYVDGVYQHAEKWKGLGEIGQGYYQFNAKLTQFVGAKGVFTFFADYSNRREVDYQDLNTVWVNKLGYGFDNFGVWSTALQAANAYNFQGKTGFPVFPTIATSFPNPVNALQAAPGDLSNDPEDAGYYGASGLRKDFLTYVGYKAALTSHLTLKTTIYGHRNDGRGLWFQPYLPTFDSNYIPVSPISLRTSEYGISRGGFLASLAYETARNTVEGGVWFEKESFDLARRFYGTTLDSPGHSLYSFPSKPFFTQWQYNFPTTVYQIHLQDLYRLNSRLTLSAGFKTVETNTRGDLTGYNLGLSLLGAGRTTATYAQGALESGKPFLPQFGANYKLNATSELFADAAYNVRAYQTGGNGFATSPWGTTQAGFDLLKTTLKPETSWSEEAGYRYTTSKVSGQANFFHVNFSNRLLAIQQGPGAAGAASILSNVGGVTTNGVDGALSVRVNSGWTLYNAVTFSRSTYDSDYNVTNGAGVTTTIPTGGKLNVDSPEFLYKNELSYNRKGFNAHIGSDYMSKRYFTYTNDNSVGGRFLADFGTSYHVDEIGPFDQLKLQLNIYNLAGAQYYSTIGTNGFVASDPTSVNNNTLQVGAPRAISGSFTMKF